MNRPAEGLGRLLAIFDRLEIPYMVGGSVASSFHGLSRPTQDVDIIAKIAARDLPELFDLVKADFYGDVDAARDSLERGRAFNLIHLTSSYKFDIFALKPTPFDQQQFSRREFRESHQFGEALQICVATAEDTILSKLRWYRLEGETSERQWEDIRGVVRVQKDRLDWEYLTQWSRQLGLDDLLVRLRSEPPKT